MLPLPRGIDEPEGPWSGRVMLALFGAGVLVPLLGVELVLASLIRRGEVLPGEWLAAAQAQPGLTALGLVLLHLLLLFGLVRVVGASPWGGLRRSALQRLRRRRLADVFFRHRRHLVAYFAEDEKPKFVVEADPPGGGVPGRVLDLLLWVLVAVASLEVVVLALHGPALGPGYTRQAAALLGTLTVAMLLLGDLDALRARLVVGTGCVGLLVLTGLDPSLLEWGPGILPAMVLLLMALVVRVTREGAAIQVLFLTNKGVRLVRFEGDGLEDPRGATLKPQRLIHSPGTGESQWELFTEGQPPLEVQPIGGHAQEIAVTGALHGFPVRITGEPGARPLVQELLRQARVMVPVALVLAAAAALHWAPTLPALVAGA